MKTRLRNGTWKNLDYTLNQARKAMKKEGWSELPGQRILSKKYGWLASAIGRYYGWRDFREKLGQKQLLREEGLGKNLEYTLQQAREIMKKEGWSELPGSRILIKKGYSALSSGINKYHGFRKIRGKLGQEQLRIENGKWQDLDYILKQTKEIMKKEGWSELPGSRILIKKNYTSLIRAITQHHNGFPKFREKLSEFLEGKSEKDKLEEVLERYLEN